jgi:hypothetical protein
LTIFVDDQFVCYEFENDDNKTTNRIAMVLSQIHFLCRSNLLLALRAQGIRRLATILGEVALLSSLPPGARAPPAPTSAASAKISQSIEAKVKMLKSVCKPLTLITPTRTFVVVVVIISCSFFFLNAHR